MGFLDKAMSQVQQAAKQGQEKLDDLQAKKAADGLLRDLGAWVYATETGRDDGQGPAEIARITRSIGLLVEINRLFWQITETHGFPK